MSVLCMCVYMHLTPLPRDKIKMGQIFFYIIIFSLLHPYTKHITLWGPRFGQRASYWVPFLGFSS